MRLIRCRMALRGFKEWLAHHLETYAGTARRASQRLVASETACHPEWISATIDVEKAFLQGLSYQELAEATGEPERNVSFTLPKGQFDSAKEIRKLPGFEQYDPRIHCLKCTRPGTGTKDAPRAFSLKLGKVTAGVGLKPVTFDPELEVRHEQRGQQLVLTAMIAKHVDDVKLGAEHEACTEIIGAIEAVFGKCTRADNEFTNCGVRQRRGPDGSVSMDQDEYIAAIRRWYTSSLWARQLRRLAATSSMASFGVCWASWRTPC